MSKNRQMKIGVFDSGVGGLSVARAIERSLPDHEVLLREDKKNLPYGTKTPAELLELVGPILQNMQDDGCALIVIACNTVSTTILDTLQKQISISLIGVEPMLVEAAQNSRSGVIAVCATPTTLTSVRYQELKTSIYPTICVEPDCSDWAKRIEDNAMNKQHIAHVVRQVLEDKADVIVLGCTHYHWIESWMREIAGDAVAIVQPEEQIVERVSQALRQLA